jgi:hypothetical protein
MLHAAVLVADYAGTLDLLDRTELRLRTTQEFNAPPGLAQTNLGLDFFTQPTIRVGLFDRRWSFEASYAPSFTFPDLELGFTPVILQFGDAHASWHDRDVTASVTQSVSYGQFNGAYAVPQSAQQPIPGQPPIVAATPAPTTVDYLASRTVGAIGIRLGPREQVTASAEYDVIGGTNGASRETVPEQYGPRANATYEHLFTRRTALLTTAQFQSTDFVGLQCLPPDENPNAVFTCSPQARIFEVDEAFRHRISRRASFAVGAGVAASVSRQQDYEPFHTTYYPTGEALLTFDLDRTSETVGGDRPILASSLRISGRLAPLVDIRTGNVYNAVTGNASLVVPASGHVAFLADGGALQYLPAGDAGAVTAVFSDAEIDYAPDRNVTFALGERGIWQTQNGFGTFLSSYGFLAVTVREPRLTF